MSIELEKQADDIIYHYCDAVAFESIMRTNELWFSPFRYSNDTMEGQSALAVLRTMALSDGLSSRSTTGLMQLIELMREMHDCYGISLSAEGDLLSQWRGYAADGAGFAIGFRKSLLEALPRVESNHSVALSGAHGPTLARVEYEMPHTQACLAPLYNTMRSRLAEAWIAEDGDEIRDPATLGHLLGTLAVAWPRFFQIKGATFKEEGEWRLIVRAGMGYTNLEFRHARQMLLPFMKYKLPDWHTQNNPICHVVLGPKNRTPREVVRGFLNKNRQACEITSSSATYR